MSGPVLILWILACINAVYIYEVIVHAIRYVA